MGFKVYVTRRIPDPGLKILKDKGLNIEINNEDRVLSKDELIKNIHGKDGVLCLLTDTIDKDVIDSAPSVKGYANYAVGYNNIDVRYATEKKIIVTNTPGVLTDTTAEMGWALLFAISRRIVEADKYVRAKKFNGWAPKLFLGKEIKGKTLGIIGAGRIGTAFALKSKGFEMDVIYYDKNKNDILEKKLNAKKVELQELLEKSDFISIHLLLDDSTKHLLSKEQFEIMKNDAILINTARGPIIKESDLADALKNSIIGGAALDVFENEPKINPDLLGLDNVIVVPHIASATNETRNKMATMAATNLVDIINNNIPPNIVNREILN